MEIEVRSKHSTVGRAWGICKGFDPRLGLVADEGLQHLATLPIVQHALRRIGNYFPDVANAWQDVKLDAIRRLGWSDAQIDHWSITMTNNTVATLLASILTQLILSEMLLDCTSLSLYIDTHCICLSHAWRAIPSLWIGRIIWSSSCVCT